MPDAEALHTYYRTLTDQELLKLKADGGLTEEAGQTLDKELARRNLTSDGARRRRAAQWLEKATAGTIGVLVLEGGERVTAEVVGLDEDEDQLSVNVISRDSLSLNAPRKLRVVPLDLVVSFEPQPDLMGRWPFSDPCRDKSFSLPRFALMTTLFLCLIVGSLPLFVLLANRPYGLQQASIVVYTLFEVFWTFASTGSRGGPNLPPYKFTCPAVRPQAARLLWRHLGFLVGLFAFQTAMLAARPHLPEWWNSQDAKGNSLFDAALLFLCFGLGYAQVFTNRSLLDRAHREFSAQGTV